MLGALLGGRPGAGCSDQSRPGARRGRWLCPVLTLVVPTTSPPSPVCPRPRTSQPSSVSSPCPNLEPSFAHVVASHRQKLQHSSPSACCPLRLPRSNPLSAPACLPISQRPHARAPAQLHQPRRATITTARLISRPPPLLLPARPQQHHPPLVSTSE